ncbi:hypothetical protein ACFQZI_19320 [Mucilaginibacter lutimaris]|uniref:MG2 domain-containing protein n=1 Tax=Mucilaginibacter lutimaris TaxID=931629 RepID=A0ABW2ZLD2_9SPHI
MRHIIKILLLLFTLNCLVSPVAYAQSIKPGGVKEMVTRIQEQNTRMPQEKLYLLTDKPNYFTGDTIWFKVHLVNSGNKKPSYISAKIYVELLNDSSRVVDRLVMPTQNGMGTGDFTLSPSRYNDGAYTLRAYTNWMQNFGENAFFHKRFYIGDDSKNNWLISEQHTIKSTAEGREVDLAVRLSNPDNTLVTYRDVQMQLLNGNKTIFKKTFVTSDQGTFNTKWILPAKADTRNLKLVLQDGANKKNRQSFPFYPGGEAQNIDVQFMPEGGYMVAGLLNKIAFKAIGDDGLGIDVSGVIINTKNQEVATFRSAHNGMGNFRMVPSANEMYKAQIKYAGSLKTIPLPPVKPAGLVLRIDNVSQPDSLKIYISANIYDKNKGYSLISQGVDTVYFGSSFKIDNGFYNLSIPKSRFATGIVNFTLLDDAGNTLNERKIFINHHDNLKISAVIGKLSYQPKDSIALEIAVTNTNGNPVTGSFAATVTDDAQVKTSPYSNNILSGMLLASELKGTIEEPGWYFASGNPDAPKALDDLLLTQGWTGFDWDNLLKPRKEPKFLPETGNSLSGKLTRMFKKPAPNAKVTLLLQNRENAMIMDTLSGKDGRFIFDNIPYLDSAIYTVKVNNKKGSTFGGEVEVDEIKPAKTMPPYPNSLMPWFVNTDNALLTYYTKNTNSKQAIEKINLADVKGKLLSEVTIRDKRKTTLKDEEGNDIDYTDLLLDEKQLIKAGRQTLYDLLLTKKGFKVMSGYRGNPNSNFLMDGNPMLAILIDGVNVNRFNMMSQAPNAHFNFLKSYLTGLLAADVKQMVIYHVWDRQMGDVLSYLVIQTRSGAGPSTQSPGGIYVYRPEPLYKARQFYKPRYLVNSTYDASVNRSTIHWEPNLVTDENGKATLSFYAADKPSTYTVNIEGTDLQGRFGAQTIKVKVESKPVN